MQIPLLHQQLLIQTDKVRDAHRSIMMHNSPVPSTEMDSLLQEIRSLYALALQLSQENAKALLEEVHLAATKQIPIVKDQVQPPVPDRATILQQGQGVARTPVENVASVNQADQLRTEPVKEAVKAVAGKNGESRVADKYSDHQTLAGKMAEAGQRRLSDSLKSNVTDLKSSIGINEKFQFIQSLFKGDSVRYQAVIEQINTSPSASEAHDIVEKISVENKWETHTASADLFREFVNRRFSA